MVTLIRGDTWTRFWKFTNKDTLLAINLTGVTAKVTVRNIEGVVVAQANTANTQIAINGVLGEVSMTIPAATTATFLAEKHRFDLELTYPTGKVVTPELDFLKIVEDVSYV